MSGLNQSFIDKVIKDMEKLGKPRSAPVDYSYIKLVFLWTLFEAWMSTQVQSMGTQKRLDYIRQNKNSFCDAYRDIGKDAGKILINGTKALNIEILPPGKSKRNPAHAAFYYLPQDTPEDMIALIYELRNRIVHGKWQLDSSGAQIAEQSAIYCASDLFEKWIRWANLKGVFM